MSRDPWDTLLERDWSSVWETLPEAPALVGRPKTAQITLRLPAGLLERVKRVAAARSVPYHVLVRSWLVDALRDGAAPPGELPVGPQAEQLNLKLESELLDRIKSRAHELDRPYHRLAREWIDAVLAREETALGLTTAPSGAPGIKELMVLLLHAANARGQDAVRGITRLQKLLFVIEQTIGSQTDRFYAYNYGPFDEGVNDAIQALKLAGFVKGGAQTPSSGVPTFAEMMATVSGRAGPRERSEPEEFSLSNEGHVAAERLRRSNRAYEQLFERIRDLRIDWDTADLVDRVYEAWPQYAERSVIKDEVAARRAKRQTKDQ